MSLKKTKEEIQEELDKKYGSGQLKIVEYLGRNQPCKVVRSCGCCFTPIYRTLKDLNYSFCEHYQQDLMLQNLKEKYSQYFFKILSYKSDKKRSRIRVIGDVDEKSFEVERSYESLLNSFKLSKKELSNLFPIVKRKDITTTSSYHIGISQKAREFFIKECNLLYPFNNYDNIVYNGNKGKVLNILCNKHSIYFNCNYEARDHKKGKGIFCSVCKEDAEIKKQQENSSLWVKRFKQKHGETYDYSSFVYKGSNINSKFLCKEHGIFEQTPTNHLKATFGCQKCGAEASNGFGKAAYTKVCNSRESELYLVKVFNETEVFYKVGITVEGVESRFKNRKRLLDYNFEVIKTIKGAPKDIWDLEQKIHKEFKYTEYKYYPVNEFQGYTECYNSVEPFISYFH